MSHDDHPQIDLHRMRADYQNAADCLRQSIKRKESIIGPLAKAHRDGLKLQAEINEWIATVDRYIQSTRELSEEAVAIFRTEEQQLAACVRNLAEIDELIGPDNETEY